MKSLHIPLAFVRFRLHTLCPFHYTLLQTRPAQFSNEPLTMDD